MLRIPMQIMNSSHGSTSGCYDGYNANTRKMCGIVCNSLLKNNILRIPVSLCLLLIEREPIIHVLGLTRQEQELATLLLTWGKSVSELQDAA
jgi:hypothetical protein